VNLDRFILNNFQINLDSDNTFENIFEVYDSTSFGQIQLAPNKVIYLSNRLGVYLSSIKFPNRIGNTCEFIFEVMPNGDNVNDTFVPIVAENIVFASLKIYNRWGKEIYTKENSAEIAWSGENAPAGIM